MQRLAASLFIVGVLVVLHAALLAFRQAGIDDTILLECSLGGLLLTAASILHDVYHSPTRTSVATGESLLTE